jgi:predicted MFS family arabinose efflux permease
MNKPGQLINATYTLGFLFFIHSYFPIYIHSSFISETIGSKFVGILFFMGSLAGIGALFFSEKIIRRFGNTSVMLSSLAAQFFLFLTLALSKEPLIIIPIFIIGQALTRTLLFNIDVFLESSSKNATTGNSRGMFLTITNIVVVLMPFLAGSVLARGKYEHIYILSALALIPVWFLVFFFFRKFNDRHDPEISVKESLKKIFASKNLKNIFISNFILRVFYATMVIYSPIYLYETIGFSWDKIGLMFSIMLLPFVLFELPLGRIADNYTGEKEILIAGFILCGLSTIGLFFINTPSFLLWTSLLFLTRVGASFIEIMTETYFFKKIDANNGDIVALYRIVDPFAYVLAPILGFVALYFGGVKVIFLLLGVLMLVGTLSSNKIRDTL